MENLSPYTVPIVLALLLGCVLGIVLYRLFLYRRLQGERKAIHKEAAQRERERSLQIFKLVSSLSASLNYQKVLDNALDMGINVLTMPETPGDRLVCAFYLFASDQNDPAKMLLKVGSARRFTPADMRIALDGTKGVVAKAIDQGEPQVSTTISQDPELSRIIALRSCHSAYCIPLRTGLDTYGVMLFAHPEAEFFTDERSELLDVGGNQVMIALQNARLYSDLEQEKERMMEIQEEARKKLARDLHDGPTQSIAALAMRVNFARRLMDRDRTAASEELQKIEELARHTTREIRHMLFTLRPLVLESKGLIAALDTMAEKMRETYAQNISIEADLEIVERLEPGKQAVIFYIIDEAINNARKHAEAAHIWVRLKMLQPDLALLEIEDDGVGFNLGAIDATYENRSSLGMVNMRERAELINGFLHIDSAEGKGTLIHVAIPLTDEAYERLRNRRT